MSTNIIAAIVTIVVSTNTIIHLHPSGEERHIEQTVSTNYVFTLNDQTFTNLAGIGTNEIVREIWTSTPLVRQPFSVQDANTPPMPPGFNFPSNYISVGEAWKSHQTNQPKEIMPP